MIWSRRRSRQVISAVNVSRTLVAVALMPPTMRAIFLDALAKRDAQLAAVLGVLERINVQTKMRRALSELERELNITGEGRHN